MAEVLETLAPEMNSGQLNGVRVAIVDAADDPGTANLVSEQLRESGAELDVFRLPAERWSGETEADAAAARLGYALHRGEDLGSLRERGLIAGDGKGRFQRLVVVTGGTVEPDSSSAKSLLWGRLEVCAESFRDAGGGVLVVERTDTEDSFLASARRRGFNTIDCAEHPAGWIALVRMLKALPNQDGVAYGLRDDATRRIPVDD